MVVAKAISMIYPETLAFVCKCFIMNSYMFNQIFDPQFILFICKLSLAMVLGLVLGLERVYAHKTAGMRTYALVSVASAAFTMVSLFIGENFIQFSAGFNPAFIAGNIIVGIGFLGAGLILHKDGHIENLTTAAGIWACAGIGMMIGFGMIKEALFMSILIFFVLGVMSIIERYVRLTFFPDPATDEVAAPKKVRASRKKITEDND
jgi:putative Mg2+ transporter-C (MgtC) family protein